MRVVIQRVTKASVVVNGGVVGKIGVGLLVLLAVHREDSGDEVEKLVSKIIGLRIFGDSHGKMNLSVRDIGGELLVVPQFTLYGNIKKGNRPSFVNSARPEKAIRIFDNFVSYLRKQEIKTETGKFGANMQVSLVNDGPVTLFVDT